MTSGHRALTIVACGAGPASALSTCVELAQDHGWTVQVTATPAALDFFDAAAIADQILLGPGGFQPHPPRTGGNLIDSYPRHLGIDEAERMLHPAPPMSCAIECEPPASAGVCLLRW